MSTKNEVDKPVEELRPDAFVVDRMTKQTFSRYWINWLGIIWRTVRDLQFITPFVVVKDVIADYSALPGEAVLCDPTAGTFTVTLPDLDGNNEDRIAVTVKHFSDHANSVTIDGSATIQLLTREGLQFRRVPGELEWFVK